ncbi:MAG: apolipoprotein N-acyltransferase [Gammaproteobacteria bacterium]|nr:apolipoprotein N-acyltransferase [Gammaproteobacteria bacterium]
MLMLLDYIKTKNKTRIKLLDFTALIAGLLLPFSYAPYNQFWLMFPLLGWLFLITVNQLPKRAFYRGWWFGMGWFAHGISWIYYSLHYHGNTPVFLATLIILLLAAYLSLFPGLALYSARKFFKATLTKQLAVIFPLFWLLSEWLRGYFLTGFPWLQTGYAQIDTPLAGYAPVIGGLGMSGLVALSSGLLAIAVCKKDYKAPLAVLAFIWLVGFGLMQYNWTESAGNKIKVSMIQGNIPQSQKWKRHMHPVTLDMYLKLTRQHWDSDLIIWPETAIPDYQHRVTYYLKNLKQEAEVQDTDVLLGLFVRDMEKGRYYNSVLSMRDGMYQKRHLVPLGEFFPFRELLEFFTRWIKIPMSDVDSGPEQQSLVTAAGQSLGINICFEDAFDRDVLKSLPEASLLVNLSNDAWFEDSAEAWQHHQIARMRALETGRYMLRSTNTGVSSIIDEKARVLAISPQFEQHVLTYDVQPMKGSTPYVIWQNYLTVAGSFFILLGLWWRIKNAH